MTAVTILSSYRQGKENESKEMMGIPYSWQLGQVKMKETMISFSWLWEKYLNVFIQDMPYLNCELLISNCNLEGNTQYSVGENEVNTPLVVHLFSILSI